MISHTFAVQVSPKPRRRPWGPIWRSPGAPASWPGAACWQGPQAGSFSIWQIWGFPKIVGLGFRV